MNRRLANARAAAACLALLLAPTLAGVATGIAARPALAQDALRIAAIVNDEVISVHDLAMRVALLLATTGQEPTPEAQQRAAPHVLRALIDEKLKMQEAKRLNVQVTREEINRALTQIAGQIGVSPDDLPRLLAARGVAISALMDQIEAEIAWVKAVTQSARAQREISDEEVDARIKRINEAAGRPEYRIAEIFLPVDDPENEGEIEALGRRIMTQLRQGISFPALARNYSEGASAATGGDLGWVRPEQLAPEIQAAVQELNPGEVLGPIRSLTGYHIVLLIDKRTTQPIGVATGGDAGNDTRNDTGDERGGGTGDETGVQAAQAAPDVRERVRQMLINERLEATSRRMLRDLRREAFVDLRL